MVALNFYGAVFGRAAGSTVSFEKFCNVVDFERFQAGDDADRARAATNAQDAHDTVVGHSGPALEPIARRHRPAFRQARFAELPKPPR